MLVEANTKPKSIMYQGTIMFDLILARRECCCSIGNDDAKEKPKHVLACSTVFDEANPRITKNK